MSGASGGSSRAVAPAPSSPWLGALLESVIIHAVVPGAVIGMVGALLFFLIDLRAAFWPGDRLLKWVGGCFVVATVLIARYGKVYADPERQGLYRAALFWAAYVSMNGLADNGAGPLGPTLGPWTARIANLLGIWGVHRLATGLVTQLSLDEDGGDEETARQPSPGAAPRGDAHRDPARPLHRLGAAALLLFVLGERVLLGAAPEVARSAIAAVVVYCFCAGLLLALSSMAGRARDVRRRGGLVAPYLLPARGALGAALLIGVLAAAMAAPGVGVVGSGAREAAALRARVRAQREAGKGRGSTQLSDAEMERREGRQARGSGKRGQGSPDEGAGGGQDLLGWMGALGRYLIWPLGALIVLGGGYLLYRSRGALAGALRRWLARRRGQGRAQRRGDPLRGLEALASMPPEQAVRAAYGRFLDLLAAAGRPRAPQETPQQVLFRLPAELRKVARQAEVLTALFHQAAYTAGGAAAEHRDQAIAALRAMREALPPSISRRA